FQVTPNIDPDRKSYILGVHCRILTVLASQALAWEPSGLSDMLDRHQGQPRIQNVRCLLGAQVLRRLLVQCKRSESKLVASCIESLRKGRSADSIRMDPRPRRDGGLNYSRQNHGRSLKKVNARRGIGP